MGLEPALSRLESIPDPAVMLGTLGRVDVAEQPLMAICGTTPPEGRNLLVPPAADERELRVD